VQGASWLKQNRFIPQSTGESDGVRILVTRFRGRGLRKGRCDVWMPNLGPSERLLRGYHAQKLTRGQFGRQYRHELFLEVHSIRRTERSRTTVRSSSSACCRR
jgi:uncharacterized protein YeaO (DUF488 family)